MAKSGTKAVVGIVIGIIVVTLIIVLIPQLLSAAPAEEDEGYGEGEDTLAGGIAGLGRTINEAIGDTISGVGSKISEGGLSNPENVRIRQTARSDRRQQNLDFKAQKKSGAFKADKKVKKQEGRIGAKNVKQQDRQQNRAEKKANKPAGGKIIKMQKRQVDNRKPKEKKPLFKKKFLNEMI